MKGAEATSGVRYPMAIAVTFQEAEHDVGTTKSSEFVDGQELPYTPRTNLLCITWCRIK